MGYPGFYSLLHHLPVPLLGLSVPAAILPASAFNDMRERCARIALFLQQMMAPRQ
jgi:hypothetical protein